MKERTEDDLARFVTAGVDDRTLGTQWAAIRERRARGWKPPRRTPLLGTFAFAALACAAAAVLFLKQPMHGSPLSGMVLEGGAEHALTLPDGAKIRLDGDGRVRVVVADSASVELILERGAATFDVPHRPSRRFVVHAAGYDVIDVGTRFRVENEPGEINVQVDEGSVRVESTTGNGPPRFLGSGERWSSAAAGGATGAAAIEPPEFLPVPWPPPPPAAGSTTASSPRELHEPHEIHEAARGEAHRGLAAASPKELLDYADTAAIGGRPRDSALALDRLRRKFPRDARAGLAAFQLGRLRFDTFGDALGAAEAFESAIALAPDAPFREDAQARLVEAFDAAKDPTKCTRAQRAYASRYPSGMYLPVVRGRCGTP